VDKILQSDENMIYGPDLVASEESDPFSTWQFTC